MMRETMSMRRASRRRMWESFMVKGGEEGGLLIREERLFEGDGKGEDNEPYGEEGDGHVGYEKFGDNYD